MKAIIITTYYPSNLRISLSRLKWLEFDFYLIVHNDNPLIKLTIDDLKNYGLEYHPKYVYIINEKRNLGCFDSRLESVRFIVENLKDVSHFIFCDDDDTLLYPQFDDNALISNQKALVVKRLKEVLELLVPQPQINIGQFVEDEVWKQGCVGIGYKVELWKELIPIIEKFKPVLYNWYGSSRVMETDDVYYVIIIRHYLEWKYGNIDRFYKDIDTYSYALTLIDDRVGRYRIDEGVRDLRYGVWDGKTTYALMAEEFNQLFSNFLKS
jgi:hypothetical protein